MTKLLDKAISHAQALPPEAQDALARLMLLYAGDEDTRPVYHFTADEMADLDEADAEIARGEMAADEDVAAIFAKYRL
jgi:hypothetical protein